MIVKVLSSGSSDGNCTLVQTSKGLNILLDVGLNFKTLQKKLDYAFINFAFVTHEHGDHANKTAIKNLLKRGTNVIMTQGTKSALHLADRHNLLIVDTETRGNIEVFKAIHDAAEPVSFCIEVDGERIYYITDTQDITFPLVGVTRLIVEANHSAALLAASQIEESRKYRIRNTHLSLENLIRALKATDLTQCKEIHLIHISSTNGNGAAFKAALKPIVGDIPTFIERVSKP